MFGFTSGCMVVVVVGIVVVEVVDVVEVVVLDNVVVTAAVEVKVAAEVGNVSRLLVDFGLSEVSKICNVLDSDVCATSEVASSEEVEISSLILFAAVSGSAPLVVVSSITDSNSVVSDSVAAFFVA